MAANNAKKKVRTRRRERKNIEKGQVHISSSFNNTMVTVTDTQGNAISWASAGGLGFRGGSAVRREKTESNLFRSLRRIVDAQLRFFLIRADRERKEAVLRKSDFLRGFQENMAVDAAAGIPAGIGRIHMLHPNSQEVFPRPDEGRQIKGKGGIAVGMLAEIVAVDPDAGMLVDPLETDADPSGGFLRRQLKGFLIPADPAGKISGSAGMGRVKGKLDGPVMGQGDAAPGPVVIGHIPRIRHIPEMKAPVGIHAFQFAHIRPPESRCSGEQGRQTAAESGDISACTGKNR